MKKRIMMFLTLLLSTLGAVAQNTITIGNAEMEYLSLGQSVSVPVTMENVDDIVESAKERQNLEILASTDIMTIR